jgi:hypothetical protein
MRTASVLLALVSLTTACHNVADIVRRGGVKYQSVVPITVIGNRTFQETGPDMRSHDLAISHSCSATYVRPHLLVTHIGCFRGNIAFHENGTTVVAINPDHVLIDNEPSDRDVITDLRNQVAFIRTSRRGQPVPLRVGPTRLGERLGKYGYAYERPNFNGTPPIAKLTYEHPVRVASDYGIDGETVPQVLAIKATPRHGESGGAVLNEKHQLVGIIAGKIAPNKLGLVSSQRIHKALQDNDL